MKITYNKGDVVKLNPNTYIIYQEDMLQRYVGRTFTVMGTLGDELVQVWDKKASKERLWQSIRVMPVSDLEERFIIT